MSFCRLEIGHVVTSGNASQFWQFSGFSNSYFAPISCTLSKFEYFFPMSQTIYLYFQNINLNWPQYTQNGFSEFFRDRNQVSGYWRKWFTTLLLFGDFCNEDCFLQITSVNIVNFSGEYCRCLHTKIFCKSVNMKECLTILNALYIWLHDNPWVIIYKRFLSMRKSRTLAYFLIVPFSPFFSSFFI